MIKSKMLIVMIGFGDYERDEKLIGFNGRRCNDDKFRNLNYLSDFVGKLSCSFKFNEQ